MNIDERITLNPVEITIFDSMLSNCSLIIRDAKKILSTTAYNNDSIKNSYSRKQVLRECQSLIAHYNRLTEKGIVPMKEFMELLKDET